VSLSPEVIASALKVPAGPVAAMWPLVLAGLDEFGINTLLVQVAAAATIQVECSSWAPCREKRANPDRQPELWQAQERYWPSGCYGRGLIQRTWPAAYKEDGEALGLDLVNNPDLLLVPAIAARDLAYFFKKHGVADAANQRNWLKARIRVNGINRQTGLPNGLNEFLAAVHALLEVAE